MKRLLLFVLVAPLLMLACTGDRASKAEMEADSLAQENKNLELFINSLSQSLDSITATSNFIFKDFNPEGTPVSERQLLLNNIVKVKAMLQRQQDSINAMEARLDKSEMVGNAQLKKISATLKKQIEEKNAVIAALTLELNKKDADIFTLKERVIGLNTRLDSMALLNSNQQQTIDEQDRQLNKVYYIVASKDKLKSMGLLTSGFLKKKKLDATNVDLSRFTHVDKRNVRTISIPAKKAELLTQHPATSYSITENKNGTSTLNIKDRSAFWRLSSVLVVKY